jgi:hypothetical protein
MTPDTRQLVSELRLLIADEAPVRLHQSGGSDDPRDPSYGNVTGLPWTRAMRRYLSHPEQWGRSRLGMLSIMEVDAWCYQRHHTHRAGRDPLTLGGRRNLCAALLVTVCYWRRDCPPELEPLLRPALRHARHWRLQRARPRLEEPLPYERVTKPLQPIRRSSTVRGDGHRRSAGKGIRTYGARGIPQDRRTG